jgi:hypothetical protein
LQTTIRSPPIRVPPSWSASSPQTVSRIGVYTFLSTLALLTSITYVGWRAAPCSTRKFGLTVTTLNTPA